MHFRYVTGSTLSSRFSQGYLSPRRRMALIENGALAHSSQAYLASPAHYHPTTTQGAAPPIELVDDFIDFVDPVLRPALPILPPPILPAYHHGKLQFLCSWKNIQYPL